MKAKIVRLHSTGDPSVLRIEETIISPPGENEVLINVEAIGLNRAEVVFRQGKYFEYPIFPSRIGYEASGIIEQVGSQVSDLRIGDRVSTIPSFSMSRYGVYGEKAVVPAYAVTKYPDILSPAEATSIWMAYLTAYGALLDIAHIKQGNTVVISAASSSVGIAALQLAKSIGVRTIALTSSETKTQFLYSNGADRVINTYSEDLVELVMKYSGGIGANIIFDPISGSFLEKLAKASAPGAIIFQYGSLDNSPTYYPLHTCVAKGITIRGYTMFELVRNPERLYRAVNYIMHGINIGKLKPQIDTQRFNLDDIVQAHEYMESNVQKGKIVVLLR